VEVDRPDAVVDLFHPDVIVVERIGEEQQARWKRMVPASVTRVLRKSTMWTAQPPHATANCPGRRFDSNKPEGLQVAVMACGGRFAPQ
jgi:hypothetical protein